MSGQKPTQSSFARAPSALLTGIDLVVLDFDGVIADSEIISLTTLQESLAAFGMEMPARDVRERFLGTSLATIIAFAQENGQPHAPATFADHWQSALYARFRKELVAVPGVDELLAFLTRRGLPYCIASSGVMERINIALDAMGMAAAFQHVFSAEQVARGKPAPDLFLHAAAEMGVPPSACLVIEDSPYGIEAARSAGMRAAGFVGGAHLHDCAQEHAAHLERCGADAVLTRFEALWQ